MESKERLSWTFPVVAHELAWTDYWSMTQRISILHEGEWCGNVTVWKGENMQDGANKRLHGYTVTRGVFVTLRADTMGIL